MLSNCFSPDYSTARNRFRDMTVALGWDLQSHSIDEKGPHGEDLTIDVAIAPNVKTDRALVLSSGIHGVEGFFGSAVQISLLTEWAARQTVPTGIRTVLIHALNPYGFAWRRRVNEKNIDLNRNLLLANEQFQEHPKGYAELDKLLNPKRPPSSLEPVKLKLLLAIARYGMPALKEAVASGQYTFPKGLFFGGSEPSRTSTLLANHFDDWLGDVRQVVHLDFHTGLGTRGRSKLLIDYPLSDEQRQRLSAWFGPDAFETVDPKKTAFTVRGSFGRWCTSREGGRNYLYAAAEFGTYKAIDVLAGLRAENQAHHWGRPEEPSTERAKQQLVELFCPRSESWRAQVLETARRLVSQAVEGMARTDSK